jgi:hypothetical protein
MRSRIGQLIPDIGPKQAVAVRRKRWRTTTARFTESAQLPRRGLFFKF